MKRNMHKVDYRMYESRDYQSYHSFCQNNFGTNNYQINQSYIEWLYEDTDNTFLVALSEDQVVGIMHNFQAPIMLNNEYKLVTVLHDLMVDDNYKGAGLHLIQNGLKSNEFAVLPGAVGRISRAYSRLGSKSFNSHWYRKLQFPRSFFTSSKVADLLNFQELANEKELLFGHNKEENDYLISRSLKKYHSIDLFSDYLKWRFSNKNAPLTFYVTDQEGDNTILFVIGKRGFLPYVRLFYCHADNASVSKEIIKFIEKITSQIGIPVILFTSFEAAPPKDLNYKVYKEEPISYVFSNIKNKDFIPVVPTFCSDIGFDGYNFLKESHKK